MFFVYRARLSQERSGGSGISGRWRFWGAFFGGGTSVPGGCGESLMLSRTVSFPQTTDAVPTKFYVFRNFPRQCDSNNTALRPEDIRSFYFVFAIFCTGRVAPHRFCPPRRLLITVFQLGLTAPHRRPCRHPRCRPRRHRHRRRRPHRHRHRHRRLVPVCISLFTFQK